MKLDALSKQCIIVGVFAIILSIHAMVIEITKLWWVYRFDYENLSQYIPNSGLKLVAFVIAASISVLKIIGIKKRNAIFVAPWVLAAFGGLAYFIYDFVRQLEAVSSFHIDFVLYPIVGFGVAFIIIYPLLTVLADICHERANDVKQLEEKSSIF